MISPDLQRAAISDYAARAGITDIEWVEKLDESASRDRSPWWKSLDEAVAKVESGQRDVVLVWKFSRAARHRRRWAVAIDRIEVAGGTLESATEGLDTSTSTGRLGRGMLAELAAWQADVIGEQWKETQERRRQMGLPHTGGPRFGYTYDKRAGYTPDPDTGPLLASLYHRYIGGEGFTSLAAWLNRQVVPTMRGGRWTTKTVLRQLDSGFAAGFLRIHRTGELLPGAHEPLIDQSVWAGYLRQRAKMRQLPPRSRRPIYPLTGLVKCGLCGQAMSATSTRHGQGYLYRCIGYTSSKTCTGLFITRVRVESAVLAQLAVWAGDVEERAAVKTARTAAAATVRADRGRMVRELTRLDEALARLVEQRITDTAMPTAVYDQTRDGLLARRAELERGMAELVEESDALSAPAAGTARGLLAEWDTLPAATRRDLLAKVVREVRIVRRAGERRAEVVVVARS